MPTTLTASSLACALALQGIATGQYYDFAREGVLGTSFALRVATSDQDTATATERIVLDEIERLEDILSAYRKDSEFSKFANAGKAQSLSTDLLQVLLACDRWGKATSSSFHAAFHPGSDRNAAEASSKGHYLSPWQLDPKDRTANLISTGKVGLDGLAKGYIIDQACAVAKKSAGVTGVMIDIGGDLRVFGSINHTVKIVNPLQPADNAQPLFSIKVQNLSVATSGSYARPVGGKDSQSAESHIRDPKDGRSANGVLGATVITNSCIDADALATALHVMAPAESLQMIESLDNYECVLVEIGGKIHKSSGIDKLITKNDGGIPDLAIPAAGLEVVLDFVIRKPENKKSSRSYRRPYVAIWIEDEQGDDVRTLRLWINRRRWLRDLKTWYRVHRRDNDLIETVSRATRRPGEYKVTWNGKDDDGNDLPQGNYVLCLEIAREHGTHQIMRAPFRTLVDEMTAMTPNEEIERASVSVRRRGKVSKN